VTTEDHDPARFAYLAEGNARQARKRVAADVLIRDEQGRILLVNPTYKPYWDLPGGMAEANESPRAAAERELREELGLTLEVGRLLTLDWQPAQGPWDDQLTFTFDGSVFDENQVGSLRVSDDELVDFRFFHAAHAARHLRRDVAQRINRAFLSFTSGDSSFHYVENQ
jgi:ADP-ribose pyrophosphatase YjhB (NUDIX family)